VRLPLFDHYSVVRLEAAEARRFICRHHYSGGCHNNPTGWGLIAPSGDLHGVCAFASPVSENVRASVFGAPFVACVTELHRLVVLDAAREAGVHTSWFVAQTLKHLSSLRPGLRAVLSFADPAENHHGGIYRACNFAFAGTTVPERFWRDPSGRLHHPRNNGKNVSARQAAARGWTAEKRPGKARYIFFLGTQRQRRWARKNCQLELLPYP